MDKLYHPAANIFPMMDDTEYEALKSDIAANGLIEPIWFCDGKILDGRNRWRACKELGISPEVKEYIGDDPVGFVVSLNLARRHLTSSQRAVVALEIEKVLEEQAKERQRAAGRLYGENHPKEEVEEIFPQPLDDRQRNSQSRDTAASIVGTNPRYVSDAKRIQSDAPELIPRIAAGEMTIPEAKKHIKKQALEVHRQEAAAQIVDNPNRPVIEQNDCVSWLRDNPQCDLLITDPPYSTDVDDIRQFAASWLPAALDKVKPTGRAYIFIGAYPEELAAYLNVRMPDQILVWTYRNTLGPQPKFDYIRNLQMILYYKMPECPPLNSNVLMEKLGVQDFNHPARTINRYHAWQKPDELAERFIRHATNPGDVVYDPFSGTGTFVLAAARLGRVGLGCDMSIDMLKIAEERGCKCIITG